MIEIKVTNLQKNYSGNIAVDDLSFKVTPGAVHGLLGPNGAGKSTIMRIMSGLLSPTAGNIQVGEHSVTDNIDKLKQLIGFLPETPPIYGEMVVDDFLTFVARLHGLSKIATKQAVSKTLERTGLQEVRNRLIGNLSKGFRQRVGIAQALVYNPPCIILDEPTVGLDPSSIVEIRELINDLSKEHTVLISSHLLHEISLTCSEITIINKGKLITSGPISDIQKKIEGQKTFKVVLKKWSERDDALIRELPFIKDVETITKSPEEQLIKIFVQSAIDVDVRDDLSRWIVSNELGLLGLQEEVVELEDFFFELTKKRGEQ